MGNSLEGVEISKQEIDALDDLEEGAYISVEF